MAVLSGEPAPALPELPGTRHRPLESQDEWHGLDWMKRAHDEGQRVRRVGPALRGGWRGPKA